MAARLGAPGGLQVYRVEFSTVVSKRIGETASGSPTILSAARSGVAACPETGTRVTCPELVARFELTGGNIANVVQRAVLEGVDAGSFRVRLRDAVRGVHRATGIDR